MKFGLKSCGFGIRGSEFRAFKDVGLGFVACGLGFVDWSLELRL